MISFRTQDLESSLVKRAGCLKELETALQEQRAVNNRQHGEIELLNEKLNSEARRIKSLERESDRLRSEIALLEAKVYYNVADGNFLNDLLPQHPHQVGTRT